MAIFETKTQTLTITKQHTNQSFETTNTVNLFVAEPGASYQLIGANERHSVLGSTTVMVVGALGSTPLGSGTNLLASTISLFSAVDIANAGTILGSAVLTASSVLTSFASGPVIGPGDAVGLRYLNASNIPGVGVVSIILQRL